MTCQLSDLFKQDVIPRQLSNQNLENINLLLDYLGNPHDYLSPVIHVAGTNGKGSTIAILASILKEAGYITHRFTSPHLVRFNERIILSDSEVSDKELLDAYFYVDNLSKKKLSILPFLKK